MPPTLAQQSWDVMRKVEDLLQRPARGGIKLSIYEQRIAGDQLHRSYKEAAGAYQSLHQGRQAKGSVLFRAQLRAKFEHPLQVIKLRFNRQKVRYRRLKKNSM